MNTWPRRVLIRLLIVIPIFGVASLSGTAQEIVDSDTAEVGLVVINSDCPFCPDETATATETVTVTPDPDPVTVVDPSETPRADSSGPTSDDFGGAPTVPVVSQLPDTGVAPSNSTSTPVLATMLTAGLLLMVGGLISSRSGASRPVK